MPHNLDDDVVFYQPKTMEERAQVAEACMLRLELVLPTLLDDMDNSTDRSYAAHPERLYVIDRQGAVAFQSGPGPFGFDVASWEQAIETIVQKEHIFQ